VDKTRSRADAFLKKHGMHYADIDIEQTCNAFLDEMNEGLRTKSSLAMLPTYIETEKAVPVGEPVIAIDAGGTNFRVATVRFKSDGQAEVSDLKVYSMPGIEKTVGRDDFFATMAGFVKDIVGASERIGFCFSYPIEMFPTKDGRVLYFSKEIKAPEVVGQMIGEGLNAAIRMEDSGGDKRIVLLNDTVATLLAGKAASGGRDYDTYVGFILGTGTNTSYVERNGNVTKAKGLDPAKSQIINVESGAFGKAPRGDIDKELDASSSGPGVNIFEKMISGAYLGLLCQMTAQKAAQEGLFSKAAADNIARIDNLTTKDAGSFLAQSDGNNTLAKAVSSEADRDTLLSIVEGVIERAAKLTAINLSSAALKSGKGSDPERPVCIVADGTTFYKLTGFRPKVESYLQQYLVAQKGAHYEIVGADNASLIGAAIAGLTN
jgi:hexokinase